MKRYWKALLIVLVLSAQQSPVDWRNGGRRSPRRNQMAAEGIAFSLAMAWAAGCEFRDAARVPYPGIEGLAVLPVASTGAAGDIESIPLDAVAAVVGTAIRGYTDHGTAYLPDRCMAEALGLAYTPSIGHLIAQGGGTDDFLVHVGSAGFSNGQVSVGIFIEGLHPERYRELAGHDTWVHSSHFVASLRDDGSWTVARDASKPAFTS
jgi:hypothetical protein